MAVIILHHGLLGGGMQLGNLKWVSFRMIDTAIAQKGHQVYVSAVHPTASVQKRARQLQKWMLSLLAEFNSEPVILVAHSMGGLDARFMLTELGMARRVSALITVCAPHRGTSWADWVLENVGRKCRGLEVARKLRLEVGALADLTCEQCEKFNEQVPNVKGVKYYSVSASRPAKEMPAFARFSHLIISKNEGANDGLVSVRSAKWGTHLTTWHADHWQTVNRLYSWRKFHRPLNIAGKYIEAIETVLREVETAK
jgi:triacylglycerol lipase